MHPRSAAATPTLMREQVTGSSYLVTTAHAQVLIDCGLFQGSPDDDRRNQLPRDLDLDQLDAVVLTHAHLDHSGRLLLLVQHGYQGPIYATPATIDVASLLLADAARIQESDAARATRQRRRAALAPIAPLFDETDVVAVMALLRPLGYAEPATIAPGVTMQLAEAGHILGSASVILTVTEQGRTQVAVFSRDLGPRGAPILSDPARIDTADALTGLERVATRMHERGMIVHTSVAHGPPAVTIIEYVREHAADLHAWPWWRDAAAARQCGR